MFITAYELTGYKIDEKQLTKSVFHLYKCQNPSITLDGAILRFEKSTFNTLEEFAQSKYRTAEGYRKVYRPFFKK
jgi:hypothetical protein